MKKAVIIGINYLSIPSLTLRGCINDAHNIRDYLIQKQGFLPENINLLTDETTVLPTRHNMLAAMHALANAAKPGDHLWISYSGHGSTIAERDEDGRYEVRVKDEENGQDETIVPLDYQTAGEILDDELRAIIDSIPAGVKVTMLSDSCHSGSIVDLPYDFEDNSICLKLPKPHNYVSADWNTKITSSKFRQYKETAADVIVLSGSEDKQTSADSVENGRPCGAATYALLETFKNAQGDITIKRLLKDMSCLLRCKGYSQKPNLSSGKSISLETIFQI